jgi:hypothetical protein
VSHESGKECIDYAEHMSFALGNCLKYIWRRDSKDNMVQNLRKGLWYLDREIKSRKVPNSLCLPPDIGLVLDHEPEPFRSIIDLIYENDGVPGWGRIEEARDMLADEISRLDKEAEANKPVPTVHHDGVVTVSVKIPESFSLCWDDRKPEVTEHPDEFTEDEEGEMPMSVNEVEDYILGLLKEAPRDMRWLRKWVCDAAGVAPNLYNSVIRWLHHSGSIESYDDHWQYVGSTPPVSETIGDKQVSVKDVEDEIIGLLVEAPRRIGWVGHWLTTHRFIDPDLVVKAMVDLRGRGHLVDDSNFLYYNWHGVK